MTRAVLHETEMRFRSGLTCPLVEPLVVRRNATTVPAIRIDETGTIATAADRTTLSPTTAVVTPVPTSAIVVPISSISAIRTPTVTASPSTKTNAGSALTDAVVDNLTTAPVAEVIVLVDLVATRIPARFVVETVIGLSVVPTLLPPSRAGHERTTIQIETFVQPLVARIALQTPSTVMVLATSGSTPTRATATKLALLAPPEMVSATVPVRTLLL